MSKLAILLLTFPPGASVIILAARLAEDSLPSISTLLVPFLVIMLLVLLNGLFVASEFSIISVRGTQMEQMANEGNKTAASVLGVIESRRKQDRWIATAQLGITVASLGLAMYGEPAIGHFIEPYLHAWFGLGEEAVRTISYVIALGLLTYLHVVLGEMVPKALALMTPSAMVLFLNRPMRFSQTLLHYPVRLLNGIGNVLLKVFRVPPAEGHARLLSPDEIELVVAESTEGGFLQVEEEEMIRNIFDFSERTVGQVMTPRTKVQAIPIDISRADLLKTVTESRHSRFPVYEDDLDHIAGILHLKDLVRETVKKRGGSFDIRLILRAAPAVPEDQEVEQLLAAFKHQRLHLAIVLDEFGGMAGIVTLEDLVEEVVGEVRDEFDVEKEPYVLIEPGIIEVAGDFLADDLAEIVYLGPEEDLPDVETVGGLIVTKLGAPPKVGDHVLYNDTVTMTVLDVDGRAVARARIVFPAPETGYDETAEPPADDH